jgi:hypothetical protein
MNLDPDLCPFTYNSFFLRFFTDHYAARCEGKAIDHATNLIMDLIYGSEIIPA